MDPYLESPPGWRGVHTRFLTYLGDSIAERLPDHYYARMEDRVYLDTEVPLGMQPDVRVVERPAARTTSSTATIDADPALVIPVHPEEVREHYIEIRDASTGHRVVTVIELLSPTNKRRESEGGRSYLTKQGEVLSSDANLVEIDLLRGGDQVVAVPRASILARHGPYHYAVVVRRATRPEEREVYAARLQARLPRIAIPLREPDADVVVELQPILAKVYAMGSYGATIDYAAPADPPLGTQDAEWARSLVASA